MYTIEDNRVFTDLLLPAKTKKFIKIAYQKGIMTHNSSTICTYLLLGFVNSFLMG